MTLEEIAQHLNGWLILFLALLAAAGWAAVLIIWRSTGARRMRAMSLDLETATARSKQYRDMLDEIHGENKALREKNEQQDDAIRKLRQDNSHLQEALEAKAKAIDALDGMVQRQGNLITQQAMELERLKDKVTEMAAQLGRME